MDNVMPILVVPTTLLTLGKVTHFAYTKRNFKESLPYFFLLLNTSFVWICQGASWFYLIEVKTASYSQFLVFELLNDALNVAPISIFIYTWTLIEVVDKGKTNCCNRVLYFYKQSAIFIFPLIFFTFYITEVLTSASYFFDYFNAIETSLTKTEIIFECLMMMIIVIIILACFQLGYFLC